MVLRWQYFTVFCHKYSRRLHTNIGAGHNRRDAAVSLPERPRKGIRWDRWKWTEQQK